jgi:hypothetical protein
MSSQATCSCGAVLVTDDEQEVNCCNACYDEWLRQQAEDRRHPDDNSMF